MVERWVMRSVVEVVCQAYARRNMGEEARGGILPVPFMASIRRSDSQSLGDEEQDYFGYGDYGGYGIGELFFGGELWILLHRRHTAFGYGVRENRGQGGGLALPA